MIEATTIGTWGGIFAVLLFWHFLVDFGIQTHTQGHGKSVRNKRGNLALLSHCLVYTVGMCLPLYFVLSPVELAVAAAILFVSHVVGDTYFPVYLWFRYVRRPPLPRYTSEWSFQAAAKLIGEIPGNQVIVMVVDQVYHLSWLWLIVWLVVRHA